MLSAFVEELGHEYEGLLIGASCDDSGAPPLTLIDTVAEQIAGYGVVEEEEEEDKDGLEEDDEEDC